MRARACEMAKIGLSLVPWLLLWAQCWRKCRREISTMQNLNSKDTQTHHTQAHTCGLSLQERRIRLASASEPMSGCAISLRVWTASMHAEDSLGQKPRRGSSVSWCRWRRLARLASSVRERIKLEQRGASCIHSPGYPNSEPYL